MFDFFKALIKPKIGVAAIAVLNGGKILMGKRRDTDLWTNVGGHIDKGEKPIDGAIRELKEESGIVATAKDLKYLGFKDVTTLDKKKIRVYAYSMNYKGPTTMLDDPDEEVWRWHWINLKSMPSEVLDNLHAKKNILLEKLGAKREVAIQKAVDDLFMDLFKGKSYAVGTIRTYRNGKKYKKQANGDWVEVRDKKDKSDWHSDLKMSDKDIGQIIVNKKGEKFKIEGWDKEYKEWFGRAIGKNDKVKGDELGFAPHESFTIHKEEKPQTFEQAQKKISESKKKTPREESKEQQKEVDKDFEFARKSAVGNKGEDLKGSARHKRNEFKNLAEIEKSGRGSELVTRDNLIKLYPIDVLDGIDKDNFEKKMVAYWMLKKFPAKPVEPKYLDEKSDKVYKIEFQNRKTGELKLVREYGASQLDGEWKLNREIAQKDWMQYEREQYYGAFMDFKKWVEETANSGDAIATPDFLNKAVAQILPYYRDIRTGGVSQKFSPKQAKLALGFVNHTIDSRAGQARKGTTILGTLKKFHNIINDEEKNPYTHDQKVEVATKIIEGVSIDKAFGIATEGKKRDDFKPQNLYLGEAEMKGQKKTGLKTQAQQEKFLMDKTKMRGLQWGNSVTDSEREHHMKYVSNAFNDLTEILGLPSEMGSFNGRLGLAIGARGKGTALAHYEPSTHVINLTRKNGVGSLAHEWGHFFDNVSAKVQNSRSEFVSKPSWQDQTNDHAVFKAFKEFSNGEGYKDYQQQVHAKTREMGMGGKKSQYWRSKHEMFARAFEKYVFHKLEKAGKKNTYLCKDVDHGLWPTKKQIEGMTPAFDKIFSEFKKSDLLKKAIEDFLDSFNKHDHGRGLTPPEGAPMPPVFSFGRFGKAQPILIKRYADSINKSVNVETDLHKEEPYFSNKFWHYPKKDAYSSERKSDWHKNQMENHDSDTVEYKSHESAHKRWKKQDELGKALRKPVTDKTIFTYEAIAPL